MREVLRTVSAAAALLAVAVSTPGAALADPGSHPVPTAAECHAHYDPYRKSTAFLTACGDHVYPLLRVTPIPGGGKEYVYDVEGDRTVYKVPPPGFDARAASDATLKKFGLPSRADLADDDLSWADTAGDIHPITPPKFLVGVPGVKATNVSSNWSGYAAYRQSSTPRYDHAYGRWKEQTIRSTSCSGHELVTWAGLGGWGKGVPLAQDGTAIGVAGMAPHEAWSEVLPDQPYIVAQPDLIATQGRPFTALVKRVDGSFFFFFMKNQYSGKSISYYVSSSHYNGGTAEVIGERPTRNGSLTPLSNFVRFEVYSARAAHPGGSYHAIGNFPHHPYNMYNSTHLLASPGALFDGGKAFYDYFHACS